MFHGSQNSTAGRQTENIHINEETYKQTYTDTDRRRGGQTDRQTDRLTDLEVNEVEHAINSQYNRQSLGVAVELSLCVL